MAEASHDGDGDDEGKAFMATEANSIAFNLFTNLLYIITFGGDFLAFSSFTPFLLIHCF